MKISRGEKNDLLVCLAAIVLLKDKSNQCFNNNNIQELNINYKENQKIERKIDRIITKLENIIGNYNEVEVSQKYIKEAYSKILLKISTDNFFHLHNTNISKQFLKLVENKMVDKIKDDGISLPFLGINLLYSYFVERDNMKRKEHFKELEKEELYLQIFDKQDNLKQISWLRDSEIIEKVLINL